MDTATSTAIEAFLEAHECIQAMPESSIRVLKLLQNSNFGMEQLLKLIKQDAAIAAKIIRTVNSAAYSLTSKITQLDRAAAYMGFKAAKEIVVSTAVSSVCKPVEIGRYATRDLWDHSVGVAVLSREFAVRSNAIDPELAFLAGILHDIGLLLSSQSEVETSSEIFTDAEDRIVPYKEIEKSYFGFDHCELGERLAAAWKFPDEVSAVINWHHSPQEAPEQFRCLCMNVFIADTLCAGAAVGFPLTCTFQEASDDIFAEAALARTDAEEVMERFKILLRLHLS